jgi:quercetin dioxygenase-like cupin family protein
MNPTTSRSIGIGACLAGALLAAGLHAQPPAGVTRTVLLKQDSSITGREAVMLNVELAPGAAEGRHTHSGDVYGFVLEGSPTLEKDGSASVTLRAGEAFVIPAGVVHQGVNHGATAAKLAVVMVAEKGKPLTTPAP